MADDMADGVENKLRDQFLGWQCLIRQHSVRKQQGKPSPGMRPQLHLTGHSPVPITVLIVKKEPRNITAEIRFLVQKTHDPKGRYDDGIKLLSEYYYQRSAEFDEELTAVFSLDSKLADSIVAAGQCRLSFDQGNQGYQLNCGTRNISPGDDKYEATYWHNHLFNPRLPGAVTIIGFSPDWQNSSNS